MDAADEKARLRLRLGVQRELMTQRKENWMYVLINCH